jgi:hypothetical protein
VLRVIDALSAPGAVLNEDAWGAVDDAVWVLDGATGVWPEQRLSADSDAAWLAREISLAMVQTHDPDSDASAVLTRAIGAVAEKASGLCDLDAIPPSHLPSASFVAARRVEHGIELSNLGDCALLWRADGGSAGRFGSSGVTRLEAEFTAALAAHRAVGKTRAQARDAVMDLLRGQRALMNHPDGYWIVDLSGAGAPHVQTLLLELQVKGELLLMSDGFYRLVEVFGRYDDDSLMDAAASRGLSDLMAELREIERGDPDCERFDRGKTHDDATGVLLKVG